MTHFISQEEEARVSSWIIAWLRGAHQSKELIEEIRKHWKSYSFLNVSSLYPMFFWHGFPESLVQNAHSQNIGYEGETFKKEDEF